MSDYATRSKAGLSNDLGCEPGLRDSMSAVSVGVYEGMYKSMKYALSLSFDGIGPIA